MDFFNTKVAFYEFASTSMTDSSNMEMAPGANLLFEQEVFLQETGMKHSKFSSAGNFNHRVGISVGLVQLLFFMFKILVRPLARHSFLLRAFKRLYFLRTSDDSLVNESTPERRDKQVEAFIGDVGFHEKNELESMEEVEDKEEEESAAK